MNNKKIMDGRRELHMWDITIDLLLRTTTLFHGSIRRGRAKCKIRKKGGVTESLRR